MGRKAVDPVCCVMHVKEPRTLTVNENQTASGVRRASVCGHGPAYTVVRLIGRLNLLLTILG